MPDEMTCFACEREPTQQCPRCGRPYCDEHGEDVCDACLSPASALPSFTLYRGSLLALLVGAALALWLILQPPGDNTNAAFGPVVVTPTQAAEVETTPTQPPATQQTPGAPAASPTLAATQAPSPTQGPAGTTTYTVAAGDSLFAICTAQSSLEPTECVNRVLELNGLSDAGSLAVGQELVIPQ